MSDLFDCGGPPMTPVPSHATILCVLLAVGGLYLMYEGLRITWRTR